ncbi:extracellular solute-binding protein [Glycomyces algeriensis]|uniref:Sugar ABC transporter substrate-binding protein n=1 Tax=Glycomyces algeriensis TaxID=256037 RepID=A0A9W6LHW6_9ACTN|nr:extracellular solute-binding protein [Glycomyces algeriensis]MDA1368693.1 extracellular solute-binding protein [Glycomyces algeriensis]MDR7351731.1 alpha-1,4-digalacturonate transport system substrate-binding protein [Glycomyces algeriensis]GLI44457.1 sugar ABC transporter substrate-binding protein [Glycomyces algeriensis]
MKRRLILTAGTAGAAALPLSACGFIGGGDETDAKTVKFWLSGDANQGGGFQKMADKYLEETGVTIDIDDIPYDDFNTRLRNAAQADGLPDFARVTAIDPIWMDQLEDLSGVASEHGVMENLLTENEEGEVPTFLTDLTAVGLYVNKSLFDEAGVAYPTTPDQIWTWDEFIAAVKEVKAATGARYGLVMDPSSHRLRSFMYQFGSNGFELGDDCKYTTDEAATTAALQFFADINDDDVMPRSVWVSGDDPNALFKSGQVAAYYSGSWQVADFQANITDFEWASALMPAQTRRATNLGGGYMVVYKGDKSEAALDFVNWLFTAENYTEICEISGFLPVIQGLDIDYGASQASFDLYNEEIAASDPVSSAQDKASLEAVYQGQTAGGDADPLKDEAVKLANGDQDVATTIANIIAGLDENITCE